MKFGSFKEFRGGLESVISEYLRVDMTRILRELAVGLTKLSFEDNFESFITEVTIPATSEIEIRNQLRGITPTKRIILRGGSGAQNVVDGSTDWSNDFVYLQNLGGSSVTVTVMFLR